MGCAAALHVDVPPGMCGLFLGGLDVIADGGCWSLLTADEELNYEVNIQRWQTEAEEAARDTGI